MKRRDGALAKGFPSRLHHDCCVAVVPESDAAEFTLFSGAWPFARSSGGRFVASGAAAQAMPRRCFSQAQAARSVSSSERSARHPSSVLA